MKIQDISLHVTHFSEELKHKAFQEDEVTVGGKIVSIIPPVNEEFPMYALTLDDHVGLTHALVPDTMMKHYSKELVVGEFVILEGFVNFITRRNKEEIIRDATVFVYSMKDITE